MMNLFRKKRPPEAEPEPVSPPEAVETPSAPPPSPAAAPPSYEPWSPEGRRAPSVPAGSRRNWWRRHPRPPKPCRHRRESAPTIRSQGRSRGP